MTHDGSFPGRPRGRRASHDNDVPKWQGYDPTQRDQREFPDLSPIRPRETTARDGRAQEDRPGRQGHADQQFQPAQGGGQPGGYLTDGTSYPTGTPGYPPVGPGGPSGSQQWPQDYSQAQQASGNQAAGQPGLSRPGSGQSPQAQPSEEDLPDWAEPDSVEAFSARWHRRGLDSRGDRRSDRRKQRRVLIGAGGAAAVVIAVAVYFLTSGSSNSPSLGFGSLVTTFLPGELQSVPDACNAVPSATLNDFLPGKLRQAAPPLNSGTNTECTWTLDNPPTYRVLEVNLQAYVPSALVANSNGSGLVATGNGSATFAAVSAISSVEYGLTHPAPKSGDPSANVTGLSGMPGGNQTAGFMATQTFDRGGTKTYVTNTIVRYRNVIVTVKFEGLDQPAGAKKYGPVNTSALATAAKTIARQVVGEVVR